MSFNPRQSNMFRQSQMGAKTPATTKKKQQQKQVEHDLIIKDNEIIDCLYELGIQFSAEDLRKPTPAKVQYLFEVFVSDLMGVRKDTVEPIVRCSEGDIEFAETQHDAAMIMAFYRSLTDLMRECGVTDFTFNDLLKPDDQRLRMILSNLINFLRFRGERMEIVQGYFEKAEQAKERIEHLYYENEDLQKRLEALKIQRKREEPAIKEAEGLNVRLTDDLRALKKKQIRLQTESEQMKQEKNGMIKMLEDQQYFIQENQKVINNLKPYIMDSPERLHQIITDMGSNLAAEKATADSVERRARALQTSADSFAMLEQDVSQCLIMMEACESELTKEEDYSRKTLRHQENKTQKENEVRELDRETQRHHRALKNAQEKLDRGRREGEEKREATKAVMRQLSEEFDKLAAERNATRSTMERKKARIELIERKMLELKDQIEEEIKQAKIEYDRLEHHIQLYISEMEQHMLPSV